MQFPVPQFTDVEDKIFGPLTLKQFGILFGAGVIIFLSYSSTKSLLVAIFFFLLFGVPALGLAFAKINGRPIYNTLGNFVKFLSSPKVLVFHKEANPNAAGPTTQAGQKTQPVAEAAAEASNPRANLKKVQELLANTAEQERKMLDR